MTWFTIEVFQLILVISMFLIVLIQLNMFFKIHEMYDHICVRNNKGLEYYKLNTKPLPSRNSMA